MRSADGRERSLCSRMSAPGLWVIAALWLWDVAAAEAQTFALPVDVRQGFVFGSDRPRTPYLFDAVVSPGIDFESFQINALVAPSYLNPKWDCGVGGSASLFFSQWLRDIGFRVSVQGTYLISQASARVALGLGIEALTLLRLNAWPGYDFHEERLTLTTSIGVDLVGLVHVISGPTETEQPPID